MTSAAAVTVPLEDQIAEVDREIRQRERVYPKWIADGRYKQETADKKLSDLRAARVTLAFLEKYRLPLRLLVQTLQQFNPYDRVIPDKVLEELLQNPGVREVMEVFPGAVVADVRDLPTDETMDLFDEAN